MSNTIALRYTTSKLASNTAFDSLATNQLVAKSLQFVDSQELFGEAGEVLNGNSYENIYYFKTRYSIIISADAISKTDIPFLQSFYASKYKYLSIDGGDYIRVIGSLGTLPIEFLEGIVEFPELNIVLTKWGAN